MASSRLGSSCGFRRWVYPTASTTTVESLVLLSCASLIRASEETRAYVWSQWGAE
ncbi:hypothetical protein BCV70DRAFT_200225 [Testicularia cyperi]|uniref:Uncharacterized protein n=1 Tax=Testicularia cyperi TaxID=1882483 RepID=A0A317XP52_9BASI|nr:hypothetical protein BCV70DRAFT_200225 [Testicularia cyperi]